MPATEARPGDEDTVVSPGASAAAHGEDGARCSKSEPHSPVVREARAQTGGAWLSGLSSRAQAASGLRRGRQGASAGRCGSEPLPCLQAERTETDPALRCGREAPGRALSLSFHVGAAGVQPGPLEGL